MSGHSKWSKIQHKKGKNDAQRGAMYTKLLRAITVAVREGGGDMDMNFSLRMAVDKAKKASVPKDNIDRAIKKGTGELDDGEVLEEIMYEAVGPEGVGIMIDCVTDNKNRTVSEVKHALSRFGASLGGPGAVAWQFLHQGVVRLDENHTSKIINHKSDFELSVIDAGAEDIVESEEGIEIRCKISDFQKVLEAVQKYVPEPSDSGLEWVAKDPMQVSDEVEEKIGKIYEALDELDDVRAVFVGI